MMTSLLVLSIPVLLAAPCCFSPPDLEDGVKIHAGNEVIDVKVGHLVPCTLDWNDDGKKDLIVGQFKSGKIRLYLNKGTDAEPRFDDFSYLEAGGKEISLPAG